MGPFNVIDLSVFSTATSFFESQDKIEIYFTFPQALEVLGKLSPEGADVTFDSFYSSHFILPFAVSSEPTYSYSTDLQERISTKPSTGNTKFQLFLKFSLSHRLISKGSRILDINSSSCKDLKHTL